MEWKISVVVATALLLYIGSVAYAEPMRFEIYAPRTGVRLRNPPKFCVPMGLSPRFVNVTIDWGDLQATNVSLSNSGADVVSYCESTAYLSSKIRGFTHTYRTAGWYNITITPRGPGPVWLDAFGSGNDPDHASVYSDVVRLFSWGDLGLTVLDGAFRGSQDLSTVPDYLPFNVTSTAYMFSGCSRFNQSISSWNVSCVTSMRNMFASARSFNSPLDSWDVSQVTDMSNMFSGASKFNQSLSNWNTSKVNDMGRMFSGTLFDQELDTWDVSMVTNMQLMFSEDWYFNRNISRWNVSRVKFFDLMFGGAGRFDQPLQEWNVSSSVSMIGMFKGSAFTHPIDTWNTSQVTSMSSMFAQSPFDGDISRWDTSKVVDMSHMFEGAQFFNQPLERWDVSSVTSMDSMFRSSPLFNQPLDKWNVSQVRYVSSLFEQAVSFNQPLSSWKLNPRAMDRMFFGCTNFNSSVASWNTSSVWSFEGLFALAVNFNQPLQTWDVSRAESFENMFLGATSFDQDISSWNVSSSRVMARMFNEARSFNQSLKLWNSKVENLLNADFMFFEATSFFDDLSSWTLCKLTNGVPLLFADPSRVKLPEFCPAPVYTPIPPPFTVVYHIPIVLPTVLVGILTLWPLVFSLPFIQRRRLAFDDYVPLKESEAIDSLVFQAAKSSRGEMPQLPTEIWMSILHLLRDKYVHRIMLANSKWSELRRSWPESSKLRLLTLALKLCRRALRQRSLLSLLTLSNPNTDLRPLIDLSTDASRRQHKYVATSTLMEDVLRDMRLRYRMYSSIASISVNVSHVGSGVLGFLAAAVVLISLAFSWGTLVMLYVLLSTIHSVLTIVSIWNMRLDGTRFWILCICQSILSTGMVGSSLVLLDVLTSDEWRVIILLLFSAIFSLLFYLELLAMSAERLSSQLQRVNADVRLIQSYYSR